MIRLAFPMLTEERRRELVKQVQKYGEETKVAIRNIRRECIDLIKGYQKNKEISEDQQHGAEQYIQEFTNEYTDKVDKIITDKEKDRMEF